MMPVFSQLATAPRYSMVGDTYTILHSGRQTNNAFALIHCVVGPGSGPPPHTHAREDELFYVLSGEITFYAGLGDAARQIVAHAGDTIFLPRNAPHTFRNTGAATATFIVQVLPGGNFDAFIEAAAERVPSGTDAPPATPPTPAQIGKVLELAGNFGISFHL